MSPAAKSFLTSTIGKKYLMAITAIIWSAFIMVHMLGNMIIFAGPEWYNKYSHFLVINPLVPVFELVIGILILFHLALAFTLKARNWRTKPKNYSVSPSKSKDASIAVKTMIYTGTIIFAFMIWHLAMFKYGPEYLVTYNGVEMRDIYKLVAEDFKNTGFVILYCIAVILVGLHLFHGVKSIFQTFGINHPRFNTCIKFFGYIYAIVVAVGFLSQPIYLFIIR